MNTLDRAFCDYLHRVFLGDALSPSLPDLPASLVARLSPPLRTTVEAAIGYADEGGDLGKVNVFIDAHGEDVRATISEVVRTILSEATPPLDATQTRMKDGLARYEKDGAGLVAISGPELQRMEIAARPMLVDPLFPAGGKAILAGPGGIGKSLLLANLAIDVANGFPWLDVFGTTRGNVIIVDAENPPELVQRRHAKIVAGRGAQHRGVFHVFPKKKVDLLKRRHREDIIGLLVRQRAVLCIFDSFLCFGSIRNENDNTEVRGFLELVGEIPRESGAAVLVVDHAPKPSLDRMRSSAPLLPRGAGAKLDWCDIGMVFAERKHESKFLRILSFPKVRFAAQPGNLMVEMTPHLVFRACEEDTVCGAWHVRAALADHQSGLTSGRLAEELVRRTGASLRSARSAIAEAKRMNAVTERAQGRSVTYFLREGVCNTPSAHVEQYEAQTLEI